MYQLTFIQATENSGVVHFDVHTPKLTLINQPFNIPNLTEAYENLSKMYTNDKEIIPIKKRLITAIALLRNEDVALSKELLKKIITN